jgi:broad specificity phosphatase PhoE
MLKLYLLRHGETEFSRRDRFCGDIDAELTPSGHEMARAFAAAHAELPFQAIVTSTRRRTIDSARPIADRTGLIPHADARLDEIFYGDWQGRSKQEVAARDIHRYRIWLENPAIGVPGGESVPGVAARASALVEELRASHGSGNILLVGHKTVLRTLICTLTGVDLRHYRKVPQPVGALTQIDLEASPRIRMLGDLSYLPAHLRQAAEATPMPGLAGLSIAA